jgi:crotonobetainyl-CoA:carnitine CoA-transferase CaiB-like acyl-CoA transferase
LLAAIEARTTQMTTAELLARMDEAGVPAGPIRDLREVFESPQAQFLGLAVTQEHPTSGTIRTVRPAIGLSETPSEVRLPPPALGQHTDEVLSALGFDGDTIARWRAEGAV